MQRKIKSSKPIFENDKENTSGSDLESLLVSSIRYDYQAPSQSMASLQGNELKSKPSQVQQSQIKKQYVSNVYIEESSENVCQICQKRISEFQENLAIMNLKLQEVDSKLNLCFGKYGKAQIRLGDIELLIAQLRQAQQETSQKMKELSSTAIRTEQQITAKLSELSDDLNRVKRTVTRLQAKEGDKTCLQSKLVEHKLQKFKDQQQFKLKQIVETIEKVGKLQRKMIQEEGQKSEGSTLLLYNAPIKKKYFRTYSICEKNRTNQSTNISYSRNYQFPK